MANPDRAERAPVDLGLFPDECGQAAVDRRRGRGAERVDHATELDDRAGVAAGAHHLEEARRAQARILDQRVADERQIRVEDRGAARAASHRLRVLRDRGAHGVMVDAEGGGDGADLPVFAEIEAANLGVLLGRDHGAPPGTRDGSRQGGGRSHALSRPQTIHRNAPARGAVGDASVDVSAGSVTGGAAAAGSLIPHAGAIRALMIPVIEAAFGTDPMAPARGADRGVAGRPCDTPTSNTRGRDHTTRRSRRGGCTAGRFSGEAACPRRRSGSALRLDTTVKPWHKRDDWLGPSEHRGGHRGSGGISSRPSPHPPPRAAYATAARAPTSPTGRRRCAPWTPDFAATARGRS